MSSISLCMIAKDEERWIGQAIRSVMPIISEIILVDTGSSDRTVAIARELGARVYYMPWKDDFSAPRNLSLQYATSDWILILDADEAIAQRDHAELVRLTQDPSLCIEFLQRHYSDDHRLSDFEPVRGEYPEWERGQGGYFESNCVRLFPNHCGIHYRGKVHELVEHSIRDIGKHTIIRTKVRIHHYGHTAEVKRKKNKSKIYTPLGQAKTVEAPKDWKNFFELGVEHNNNGRLVESVEAFQKAIELNPYYTPTWINMGYVQCELSRYQEAITSLQNAIKIDPKSDEAYCNMGVVYMRVQKLPLAEQCFRQAVILNPRYVNAYCNLGTCLALVNRLAEAVNIYLRVLEMFPNCLKAHSELGAIYLSAKMYRNSEKHLRRAIELGSEESRVYLHLGQVYKIEGRNIEAVGYLQNFCRLEEEQHKNNMTQELRAFLQKVCRECDILTNRALLGDTALAPVQERVKRTEEDTRGPETVGQVVTAEVSTVETVALAEKQVASRAKSGRKKRAASPKIGKTQKSSSSRKKR